MHFVTVSRVCGVLKIRICVLDLVMLVRVIACRLFLLIRRSSWASFFFFFFLIFFSVFFFLCFFFFFKQKTAYEIVDCDWSSDVCSSDLVLGAYFVSFFDKDIVSTHRVCY